MHRLTKLSLEYPKITLLVIGCITVLLGLGLPKLRTEFGYRVLIGDDHPTIRTLDHFIAQYGGGLPLLIAWECVDAAPCRNVFDASSLEMADSLARAIDPIPGVQRVTGPGNAPLLVPTGEGFGVRRLVVDGLRVDDARELGARAVRDPFWEGTFVSTDGKVGAIIVQPVDNDAGTSLRVFEGVQAALAPFEAQGFAFHQVGEVPSTVVGGRDLSRSSSRLVPVTVAAIGAVLLLLSGSWREAALALSTVGLALLWTLGFLGLVGWPRDGILEVLSPLILVVGVCDAIHLLASRSRQGSQGEQPGGRRDSLLAAARSVAGPCVLTSLTTVAAFLSFATSPLDTFTRFGVTSSFGILSCLLLTFSFLPIVASIFGIDAPLPARAGRLWNAGLEAVANATGRRALICLALAALLGVVCAFGWLRLRVDTDWLESLGEKSERVRWTRFVEQKLSPSDTLEIELARNGGQPLTTTASLRALESFVDAIQGIDGFGRARSVVDLLRHVNRLLHDDDPSFERLGETDVENAELLELLALEGPDVLSPWMSLDRSRLRISVRAMETAYSVQVGGMEELKKVALPLLPQSWEVQFSGEFASQIEWLQDVQSTQLRSFPTAFALVFLMVAAFLRSWRLGAAAMVPTFLPVVVTLGTMGWLGMSLDVGRAMIAAVVIGIGVDDSIHLLHAYQQRRAAGEGTQEAMRGAILQVGRAVVTTSIALSLGFLTLMASAWQTIASFGLAVSMTILAALVATLFVLPAILLVGDELRRGGGDLARLGIDEPQRVGSRCID